ncbi:MAG: photosystem II reaction center protein Ycf12 [Cyanobium sp.]
MLPSSNYRRQHFKITIGFTVKTMGIDIHLIANFAALALITLAGPAVIFVLFYRRGAL